MLSRLWVSRWRYSPEQGKMTWELQKPSNLVLSRFLCTLLLLLYGCGLAQSFLWPIDGMRTDHTDSGALRNCWTHSRSAGKWMTLAALLSSFVYPLSVSYNFYCFHRFVQRRRNGPVARSRILREREDGRWARFLPPKGNKCFSSPRFFFLPSPLLRY